ncbi:hypothetical protein N5D_27510 [Enterococcus faecalis]|nr:hypothetical protein N5D_27510 [Enterococcus faecalis]
MKTLIKNVHILTMDEQFSEIKAGYLVIEEDTIVELAPMTTLDEKRMAANQVIDGQNGILMPGMINTHTPCRHDSVSFVRRRCARSTPAFSFSIRTIHDKRISRMQ